MSRLVLANARIFEGTGREPFGGEVLVEDTRIAAVTAGRPGPRPEGARDNSSPTVAGGGEGCAGPALDAA